MAPGRRGGNEWGIIAPAFSRPSRTARVDPKRPFKCALAELVWGKGFLSPGGPDNVKETVAGLDLADKLVLDIGCGIGGPALVLAGELGARVIGFDLEAPLIARAEATSSCSTRAS